MDFNGALSYLLGLGHETLTIKLGLSNTETLLSALGNPQKSFHAVQIAGTNGKGSTAAMLDSICRAGGIRTGIFTSPHLISITERIRIDGREISQTEFAQTTALVKKTAEALVDSGRLETLPTFFEHLTAIALLAFREAGVELAILETGLGGRLDATTAAGAEIVAITTIAMDHEEHLGKTLGKIAAEKAAIIRAGVTAITAPQEDEVREVILNRANNEQVELGVISRDSILVLGTSADGRCRVTFQTSRAAYKNTLLGLRGRHQVTNAAVAIGLAEALKAHGFAISNQAIREGLETVAHAGRLEVWETQPRILFDGAHNAAAARALREYLDEFVKEPIIMIFGAMRDKALDEMGSILFPAASALVLTEMDNPRGASLQMLKAIAARGMETRQTHFASSPARGLATANALAGSNGLICVTGSLYLVGAVQEVANTISLESASAKA